MKNSIIPARGARVVVAIGAEWLPGIVTGEYLPDTDALPVQTDDGRRYLPRLAGVSNLARLVPVRIEVGASRNGRPGYRWADGFKVIAPDGAELQPYMRKREAREFCKAQGWRVIEQGDAR